MTEVFDKTRVSLTLPSFSVCLVTIRQLLFFLSHSLLTLVNIKIYSDVSDLPQPIVAQPFPFTFEQLLSHNNPLQMQIRALLFACVWRGEAMTEVFDKTRVSALI